MCLGEVGRVVRLLDDGRVEVRTPERTLAVSLIALEGGGSGSDVTGGDASTGDVSGGDAPRTDVSSGDWLLVHAGFALERLGADEAADALALRNPTEVPT